MAEQASIFIEPSTDDDLLDLSARDEEVERLEVAEPDPPGSAVRNVALSDRQILVRASVASVLGHAAVAILLFALMVLGVFSPPHVEFVRGDGAAPNSAGLSADADGPTAADLPAAPNGIDSTVPKTVAPVDTHDEDQESGSFEKSAPPPLNSRDEDAPPGMLLQSAKENPETAFGNPKFPSHRPPFHEAKAVEATSSSETARPAGVSTASVAVAVAAPARHQFSAPRLSGSGGGGGSGGVGNGVDSRGVPIPDYPAESRRRHEEGLIELDVLVLPDGSVGEVKVMADCGYPRLVRAAVEAIRAAHFAPALLDGDPIAAHVVVPFRFTLQ